MKILLRVSLQSLLALSMLLNQIVSACPVMGAIDLSQQNFPKTQYPFIESGSQANEFSYIEPMGVAISDTAKIYILDSRNSKVRIATLEGKELKYFGKVGQKPGMFVAPKGLAIDSNENIYIADSGNNRIQRFDKNGLFLGQWGKYGYAEEELINPTGIAVDEQFVYVADTGKNRIVVFRKDGTFVRSFGRYGGGEQEFNQPVALATDGYGNIYIADSQNDKIKKFSRNGKFYQAWGVRGSLPGQITTPFGLAYVNGMLYVAELGNHRVQVFHENGKFDSIFGPSQSQLNPLDIRLHYPASIAASANGKYKVACLPLQVQCQSYALDTVVQSSTMEDSARWEQGVTRFQYGSGIAVDNDVLAVLYPEDHAVLLLDSSTNKPKLVSVIGGYGSAAGKFKNPSGVAIDSKRNLLYVSDAHNHRVQIFNLQRDKNNKLSSAKFKLAIGQYGQSVGKFNEPGVLVKSADGSVLVMDTLNNRVQAIDVNIDKMTESFADTSHLNILSSVPYFTASENGEQFFWLDIYLPKVVVSDKAGAVRQILGERSTEGRRRQAEIDRLVFPAGVALDELSNVYIVDSVAQTVKKFDAKGQYLMKWGEWGGKPKEFYKPKSTAVDIANSRIIVIDFGNNRGQIFSYDGALIGAFGIGHGMNVPPEQFLSDVNTEVRPESL